MKIFLDANVLFSMSNRQSDLNDFFNYLIHRRMVLCTCPYTLNEAVRNVADKRPSWQGELNLLLKQIEIVGDAALDEPIVLNSKDRPVLGAAVAAECDYLLTGDKRDFGHLYGKTVGGVEIVSYKMLTLKLE